jgi:class 3 adenylate cyclase
MSKATTSSQMPHGDPTEAELRHDIRNVLNHIVGYTEMSAQTAEEYGSPEVARALNKIGEIAKSILPTLNAWRGRMSDDGHSTEVSRLIVLQGQRMNEIQLDLSKQAHCIDDPSFQEDLQRLNMAARNLIPLARQLEGPGTEPRTGMPSLDDGAVIAVQLNATRVAPRPRAIPSESRQGLILVADDSDDNRQLLVRYVEREGYSTLTACDGKQALDMLRRHSFDAVLLDMIMPEIDGVGVLTEIRRDAALRDIAVIMISAVDDISRVAQCIQIGADDYLSKPFNSVILTARIHALLDRKRLRDLEREKTGQLEKALAEIEKQRQLAEKLLCNILPDKVAEELREKGLVDPMYFEDVTIVFTDFVGFTLSTEKLPAEELVQLLHQYFTAFDQIVSSYGLEKLKTVGDSYMCASGLPTRTPSHPVDAVMAAFEMVDYVKRTAESGQGAGWHVRVGLHTGPVIAGVVGIRKFAFDIWGESVNMASRMESSGAPGRINVSERTYTRVKDFFSCEHRGKVKTKEGREIDMYFVDAVSPALMAGQAGSPPPGFLRRYKTYFQKDLKCFPPCLSKEAG